MHVVGEVIEIEQAGTLGTRIPGTQPFELLVVGRALGAVTIDEIQQAAADALDGWHIERFLRGRNIRRLSAEREGALIGQARIDHPKGHRRRAGAVRSDEAMTVGARLFVDQVIDVALAIHRDRLGLVARHRRKTHQPEQGMKLLGLRVRIFDELEAVGAHRVVIGNGGGGRIVRKRTHGKSP